MPAVRRPPLYPRYSPAPTGVSSQVRRLALDHCHYRVTLKADRAIVWCRPVSPEAVAWMRARGVDAERVVCDLRDTDAWIIGRETAIRAAFWADVVAEAKK